MAKKYYAVKAGRTPGIYETWADCQSQTNGFPNALFKSFTTRREAECYLSETTSVSTHSAIDHSLFDPTSPILSIYVDGSANHDYRVAGYGFVFLMNDKPLFLLNQAYPFPSDNYAANVAAELKGTMEAIRLAILNGYQQIQLHYDYSGIKHFALNEWEAKDFVSIEYQNFMRNHLDQISIEFIKVKSHSGDRWNDEADRLAIEAVHSYIDKK